jgi:hypothetical protein
MALLASLALCSALIVRAGDDTSASPSTQPSTQPVVAFNKFCPVHPENAVDPSVPVVMYEGKAIGFCCSDCAGIFAKNPAKYAANIK